LPVSGSERDRGSDGDLEAGPRCPSVPRVPPFRANEGRGASALLSAETREAAHVPCLAGEQGSELTAPKADPPTSSGVASLASCASLDLDRLEPCSAEVRGEQLLRGLLQALAVLFAGAAGVRRRSGGEPGQPDAGRVKRPDRTPPGLPTSWRRPDPANSRSCPRPIASRSAALRLSIGGCARGYDRWAREGVPGPRKGRSPP
jgi:hypothetical protein